MAFILKLNEESIKYTHLRSTIPLVTVIRPAGSSYFKFRINKAGIEFLRKINSINSFIVCQDNLEGPLLFKNVKGNTRSIVKGSPYFTTKQLYFKLQETSEFGKGYHQRFKMSFKDNDTVVLLPYDDSEVVSLSE